ncbi:hypothetical protein BGZ65_008664 [Modicella reniformis]|uniref:Uncharacterized protein n=1 Tax=Modicella reniformis TaxID=1440133 RepID=A0A9P6IU87_9FUNG|nr:hypothetical protein BGZ65_008664 [Modicella reniformis]
MDIHAKILNLDFEDCRVLVRNVDSQKSLHGSIMVQVLGEMSNKGGPSQKFVQTFFLAEQPLGYYVLNDIFRYLKEDNEFEPDVEEPSDSTDEMEIVIVAVASEAAVDEVILVTADVDADTETDVNTATVVAALIPVEAAEPVQPAKEEAPVEDKVAIEEKEPVVVEEKKPPTEEKKPVERKYEQKKHERKSDKKDTKKEFKKDDNREAKKDLNKEIKKDDNRETKKDGNKEAKKDNRKEAEPADELKTPEPSTNLNGTPTPTSWTETAQTDDSTSATASTAPAATVTTPAEPSKPSSWAGLFTNSSSQSGASQAASTKTAPVVVSQQAPKPQATQSNAPLRSRPQGGQRPNGRDDGIYVRNITEKMSLDQLREAFGTFGAVKSVELTGIKKNCAYVDFETVEAVQAALKQNKVNVGSEVVMVEERHRTGGVQNGGGRSFNHNYQNGNGPNNHHGSHGGHRGRSSRGGGAYQERRPMQKPEKVAPTVTVN